MSEYREGGRHDQRRSDPHGGPGGDELARGAGERGQRRCDPEDDKAGVESEATAVTVAESAGCEQQSGEHQAVGVDDPLQSAGTGVQVPDERRQGHVQRGVRHHDHDQAQTQDAQRPPPPFVVAGVTVGATLFKATWAVAIAVPSRLLRVSATGKLVLGLPGRLSRY